MIFNCVWRNNNNLIDSKQKEIIHPKSNLLFWFNTANIAQCKQATSLITLIEIETRIKVQI